ncbi:hypothetical protein CH63R_10828 [Colletotrichum higginsianum IMI 349063]|uniref:Uncharacterized protein n=2 Tax=Colletotrichum higginsianum TaxID=80884 RepID=A0A1B7Y3Y3_COLHI|nr:uncharacterized protein CH63R_10828 [Colletotrichum higginsianum IMI 349063]OBR06708.1 hypothetical protein CH63R_10828 [Colletotrichum higginsianum IMI 349063]TIC97974.1 hypothetical protein CH35J_007600 [Colletotrichum higginsianum]
MILLKLSIYAVSLLYSVIASTIDNHNSQGDADLVRPREVTSRGQGSGGGGGNLGFSKDEHIWMHDRGDREDVLEGIPITFGSTAKWTEDSEAARTSTAEEPSSSSSIPSVPLDYGLERSNSLDPSEVLGEGPVMGVSIELDNHPGSQ